MLPGARPGAAGRGAARGAADGGADGAAAGAAGASSARPRTPGPRPCGARLSPAHPEAASGALARPLRGQAPAASCSLIFEFKRINFV